MANGDKDTFEGALQVILRQITDAKVLADADAPFLIQLETQIINKIRDPERQMQKMGLIPPAGQNPQGAAQLGLPGNGGMGAPPPGVGGGPAGLPQAGPAPQSAGELQRVLAGP